MFPALNFLRVVTLFLNESFLAVLSREEKIVNETS
jgi:hypothetical protein